MRRVVGFLLFFCCFAVLVCNGESFRNPYRLILPVTPSLVVHGDLNGDGFDDIIYSDPSTTPATIHPLMGNGTGRYSPGPILALPAGVLDNCKLGDFNGDHHLDLACTKSSTVNASMVLFPGNGDGTFASPKYIPLPSSPYVYFYLGFISPGDLNGDGVPDLLGVDPLNGWAWPILSDGTGGFKIGAKTNNFPFSPSFLDVNGDGKLDMLWFGPTVALGNGDGTFAPSKIYGNATNAGCAFGDLDGDGHPDAACQYVENVNGDIIGAWDLLIFHGNPDGTFNGTPEYKRVFGDKSNQYEDYGSLGSPVAIADINSDGIPDIVTSSVDGTTILYGQPGFTFADPVHYVTGSLAEGYSFIADVNGDGFPDVVSAGDNGIYFSYSQRNGVLKTAAAFEVTGVISYAVTADFDGDGIPDVVASGDNYLAFSHGNGDGTFQPYSKISTGSVHFNGYNSPMIGHIMHGDFNGDGKQDLIVYGAIDAASVNPQYYYLQGNGDGTFKPIQPLVADNQFGGMYDWTHIRDVNGDHRDDILRAPNRFDGTLTLQLSNGDGSFTTKTTTVPLESDGNSFYWPETVPAPADFDKDGKVDLVFAARENAYVLPGKGDGTFGPAKALPLPHSTDGSAVARSVITGDFDGDGNADFAVLWGGYTTGGSPLTDGKDETFVFYGKGDGTFSAPVVADTSNEGFAFVDAADLNNDGRDEIILHGAGTLNGGTNIAILHGQANRTFQPEANYQAGNGLASLDIADLNRDGFLDLVFSNGDYNGAANSVTVLMNLGNTPQVTGVLTASPEPSRFDQPVTLTATLSPPQGVSATLTGDISFSIDGTPVGTATLVNNTATLAIPPPFTIGSRQLTAVWQGDSDYAPVTLAASHLVTGIPVTVTITAQPNPAAVGQFVTITQSITNASPAPGDPSPTGTFTLTDNGVTIGTGNFFNGGVTRGFAPAGNHTLTLNYSGDSYHSPASSSAVLVVTPIASTITLQSTPNPSTYSQSVTFTALVSDALNPEYKQILTSGTVTFSGLPGGPVTLPVPSTVIGNINSVTYTTATLPAGSYNITAAFSGNASLNPSTSAPLTQIITPAASTTTLTATPNPAYQTQTVNFSINVSSPAGTPTGTVQLLDGGAPIATLPLTSGTANTAQASFSTALLALGVHQLTASYSGDSNHLSSSSSPFTETILLSSFTLTLDPATVSLSTGHHTTLTLTATSVGVFADSITLTAANLPEYTTLTFTPQTVQLTAGSTATSKLYLDTDAVIGYMSQRQTPSTFSRTTLAIALTPLALLFSLRRRRNPLPTLLAAAAFALLVTSIGCSGKYPSSTPPGTYKISITGTPASGRAPVTVTLPLTVTP